MFRFVSFYKYVINKSVGTFKFEFNIILNLNWHTDEWSIIPDPFFNIDKY